MTKYYLLQRIGSWDYDVCGMVYIIGVGGGQSCERSRNIRRGCAGYIYIEIGTYLSCDSDA